MFLHFQLLTQIDVHLLNILTPKYIFAIITTTIITVSIIIGVIDKQAITLSY